MKLNYKKVLNQSIKNTKILALSSLVFCAGEVYAQQQVIRLPEKAMTLQEIFKQIEKQTQMSVDYNNNKVTDAVRKKKMNIDGGNIQEVLDKALAGSGLSYRIEGNHIVIFQQSKPATGKKRTISGVIVDAAGEPIIGGTVQEKGTSNGTITDFDGKFTLTVPEGALLSISYVGYQTQEVTVDGSDIKVKLREDTEMLDEVVVIGYGTSSAKKMVSAVTAVKGEKLQGLPESNMLSSLQGRASGVVIQNQGGEPGSTPKISIRGGGTPVYVIDGVIASEWDFNTLKFAA